jgi:hypothetical protein
MVVRRPLLISLLTSDNFSKSWTEGQRDAKAIKDLEITRAGSWCCRRRSPSPSFQRRTQSASHCSIFASHAITSGRASKADKGDDTPTSSPSLSWSRAVTGDFGRGCSAQDGPNAPPPAYEAGDDEACPNSPPKLPRWYQTSCAGRRLIARPPVLTRSSSMDKPQDWDASPHSSASTSILSHASGEQDCSRRSEPMTSKSAPTPRARRMTIADVYFEEEFQRFSPSTQDNKQDMFGTPWQFFERRPTDASIESVASTVGHMSAKHSKNSSFTSRNTRSFDMCMETDWKSSKLFEKVCEIASLRTSLTDGMAQDDDINSPNTSSMSITHPLGCKWPDTETATSTTSATDHIKPFSLSDSDFSLQSARAPSRIITPDASEPVKGLHLATHKVDEAKTCRREEHPQQDADPAETPTRNNEIISDHKMLEMFGCSGSKSHSFDECESGAHAPKNWLVYTDAAHVVLKD